MNNYKQGVCQLNYVHKMDKSIKGAGKLSRKLLTILVLSAMATSGYAVDNSIFIDQSGSNSNLTITQDGAGNTVKGLDSNGQPGIRGIDAATIKGDNVQLNVQQVGSGNSLALGIDGSTMNGYRNTTVNYSATAQSSSALINVKGASNQIDVTQTGNNSSVDARINGGRSTISINSAGTSDSVTAGITGGDSSINVNLSNTGGSNTITANTDSGNIGINVNGTGNTINAQQTGAGNSITIGGYTSGSALTGNDNNINIQQGGVGNSANIGITGSTNYLALNQGSGSNGQEANIKISGNSNNVNISQGVSVPLLTLPIRAQ